MAKTDCTQRHLSTDELRDLDFEQNGGGFLFLQKIDRKRKMDGVHAGWAIGLNHQTDPSEELPEGVYFTGEFGPRMPYDQLHALHAIAKAYYPPLRAHLKILQPLQNARSKYYIVQDRYRKANAELIDTQSYDKMLEMDQDSMAQQQRQYTPSEWAHVEKERARNQELLRKQAYTLKRRSFERDLVTKKFEEEKIRYCRDGLLTGIASFYNQFAARQRAIGCKSPLTSITSRATRRASLTGFKPRCQQVTPSACRSSRPQSRSETSSRELRLHQLVPRKLLHPFARTSRQPKHPSSIFKQMQIGQKEAQIKRNCTKPKENLMRPQVFPTALRQHTKLLRRPKPSTRTLSNSNYHRPMLRGILLRQRTAATTVSR